MPVFGTVLAVNFIFKITSIIILLFILPVPYVQLTIILNLKNVLKKRVLVVGIDGEELLV